MDSNLAEARSLQRQQANTRSKQSLKIVYAMPIFYKSDHPMMRDFSEQNGKELNSETVDACVSDLFGYIRQFTNICENAINPLSCCGTRCNCCGCCFTSLFHEDK